MINPDDEIHTAVDVIRCVYLARVAAKRGNLQSARRWQAKADAWLERTRAPPRDVACTSTALPSAL